MVIATIKFERKNKISNCSNPFIRDFGVLPGTDGGHLMSIICSFVPRVWRKLSLRGIQPRHQDSGSPAIQREMKGEMPSVFRPGPLEGRCWPQDLKQCRWWRRSGSILPDRRMDLGSRTPQRQRGPSHGASTSASSLQDHQPPSSNGRRRKSLLPGLHLQCIRLSD